MLEESEAARALGQELIDMGVIEWPNKPAHTIPQGCIVKFLADLSKKIRLVQDATATDINPRQPDRWFPMPSINNAARSAQYQGWMGKRDMKHGF